MAKVFDVDIGGVTVAIFGGLRRAAMTRNSETRMARQMRQALRIILNKCVSDAAADGTFPTRTGKGYRRTKGGGRSFGTTFASLRGHIIGPTYVKLLEEGGIVYPVNAQALAIPLAPHGARPDGTPKLAGPRSWQNIVKTFIYKSKKTQRLYIAYKGPEGLRLLYLLVDQSEFKERRFLQRAWSLNKGDLMQQFGQIMLAEFALVDLGSLARIKTKGK